MSSQAMNKDAVYHLVSTRLSAKTLNTPTDGMEVTLKFKDTVIATISWPTRR